ncbi:MAG TPA: hypothetical protein VIJ71_02205 [Mycobacteriales bacterium]
MTNARWTRVAISIATIAVVAGCGTSRGVATASPTTAVRPAPSTPALTTVAKPLLAGLIDKGSEGPYHLGQPYAPVTAADLGSLPAGISGVVVNATWAQLEPSPGTFDLSVVTQSLAAVGGYDRTHPGAQLGARLRVFAAFAAPTWAKGLGGPPLQVPATRDITVDPTLGRWWEQPYRDAWSGLQQALAQAFDGNPVLRDVAVSSCSSLTAEPFVLSPATERVAATAGWTAADQSACLEGAFTDYAAWRQTSLYYPGNAGTAPADASVTAVLTRCAQATVPRCIVGINNLSPTAPTGRAGQTYSTIDSLWTTSHGHAAVSFQMNGPDPATYCASIAVAVATTPGPWSSGRRPAGSGASPPCRPPPCRPGTPHYGPGRPPPAPDR